MALLPFWPCPTHAVVTTLTLQGSVCPSQHSVLEEEEEAGAEGSNDGSSTHEDLSELQIGIEIKGLEKKFKVK